MVVRVTVTDAERAKQEINQALGEFITDQFVTIGIHEDTGQHESDDINNATLGAIHHFGADIDHPGGTPFGYATEAAAERGEVRFLREGEGFLVLGRTEPHKINIPARPWLDVGVATGNQDYIRLIEQGISNGQRPEELLNQLGLIAAAKAQQYMTDLRTPPNAPSTIRRKGSDNPLIDSGALRQSVAHKITTGQPTEGLE